jgi:membrane-bound lytic murein transglycosylase B
MQTTGPRFGVVALAVFAAGVFLFPLLAAEQTPFASIAKLATALSENDTDSALDYFDPQMKNYGDIEQRLEALTAQADISCAIDIVTDVETDGVHKLDLDWLMQLKSQGDDTQIERRRERVQVEMRQIKNVWKITVISPLTIFNPIHIR